MKDDLHAWLDTFFNLHSRTLASRTKVIGECNKPAGPRRYFARIKVTTLKHPVDSSPMVFRLAGRDAARKILYPNHLDQNKSAPIAFTMGRPFHLF